MSDPVVEVAGMDPYAVLGLRAGAPRELVEEAYWLLVGRHSTNDGSPEIERRRVLHDLNTAYEKIAREPGRAVAPGPVTQPGRAWWRRQSVPQAWTYGPHQTLHLSNEADEEIATLARRVLTERAPTWMSRAAWEDVLSSAVARLQSNGAETGKHEESPRTEAREAALVATVSETVKAKDAVSASAVRPQAPALVAEVAVANAAEQSAESIVVAPAPADIAAATSGAREGVGSTSAVDDPAAIAVPQAVDSQVQAPVAIPAPEVETEVVAPAPKPSPRREATAEGHHTPLLGRVLHRKARQDELDEHLQSRLLQLRDHHGNGASAPAAAVAAPAVRAEPRRELSTADITESGADVSLGDGAKSALVRIWRRGGTCLMQLAEGGPVLVNDEPLHAPVIVLEAGDRISFEGHEVLLRDG